MDKLRILDEAYLPIVTKPSRYTGSFLHAARKNPADVKVKTLLCFPDLYEIGMSYLGIKILYHILNKRPDSLAELCFTPWGDMEQLMRAEGIPLYSLESRTPAGEFDTLQYERVISEPDENRASVWLAKDRFNFPVRVVFDDPKGLRLEQTLVDLQAK